MRQSMNQQIDDACMPACLPGWLFFSAASLSLSLSPRLRVRASPCVSLYVSLFFVYVWPFSWSIALSAKRTLLFMIYDIFMIFIGCFSVAIFAWASLHWHLGLWPLGGVLTQQGKGNIKSNTCSFAVHNKQLWNFGRQKTPPFMMFFGFMFGHGACSGAS